jgi:polyisoprenoid-binding protein YceI
MLLAVSLACIAPAWAETRTWSVQPSASGVSFEARFTLGDFTGEASGVAGDLNADALDLRKAITGAIRVHATALRTGVTGRDKDMHRLLATDKHPDIVYTVEGVEASFQQLSDKTDTLLTIRGTLAVRGATRPVTFLGRVRQRAANLWVRGQAQVKMSDFGISPPRRWLFFKVEDEIWLRFDLTLAATP